MWSYLYVIVAVLYSCIWNVVQPTLVHFEQEGKKTDQRVYTGKELQKARELLKGHAFNDKEIRSAFYSTEIEAVLLEMTRAGGEIQEIRISRSTTKDKGRFLLLKTLRDAKDRDFMGLVKYLRL